METKHFKLWCDNCIKKLINQKSLFLLDSYGSHKTKQKDVNKKRVLEDNVVNENNNLLDEVICDKLDIEIIPKSTTGMIQPLDRFYFRQFKIVYRKVVNIQVQLNIQNPTKYNLFILEKIN